MKTSYQGMDQLKPRVLVVDDEEVYCELMTSCLQQTGFSITCAGNAADACNLLEQELYDVVITDVKMPGEDGIAFLGHIHQRWPDIPVIVMTGYAQLQMAVDAIKNGAFDFVHKPLDLGYMRKIAERAVDYARLQQLEKCYRAELEDMVARRTWELKQAMIELNVARSELLKSATEKTAFISSFSHEMRTPMNGVVGGLSLLEDEVTTAEGREYLEIVRQSADNMVALIDELLMYVSEGGLGSGAARKDLINLEEHLNTVVAEYRAAFDQKGISLVLHIASDVPQEIRTDKKHLNHLLEILIGNALKFTDQGRVVVEITRKETDDTKDLLCFTVTDSGVGIPEGMLERIFEPFVQADGTFTRRHGGVGVGLAIARKKALILNGTLWAEHMPDGGSSFKFTMKAITT